MNVLKAKFKERPKVVEVVTRIRNCRPSNKLAVEQISNSNSKTKKMNVQKLFTKKGNNAATFHLFNQDTVRRNLV